MIRLLAAALIVLTACGEAAPPERRNPQIAVSDGVSVSVSGTASIGVAGKASEADRTKEFLERATVQARAFASQAPRGCCGSR